MIDASDAVDGNSKGTRRAAARACALLVRARWLAVPTARAFVRCTARPPRARRAARTAGAVEIAPIPSRVGQRIRNELIFQNTGGGEAPHRVPASRSRSRNRSIRRLVKSSGEALSQVYNLDAIFTLVRMSDKKVLVKGNSYARAEFERFQQIYSNVRAKEDAENRAAQQIADDIRTRIAIALSREKV